MTINTAEPSQKCFCSWSGGKDSCLALWRARTSGFSCVSLFTMIDETGKHSRSHGLGPEMLAAQAASMNIPLRTAAAPWETYEARFREQATRYKNEGVLHGVFGDIDLEPHREWVMRVCGESGITAHEPLWLGVRRDLVKEFITTGFRALIVVVNTQKMPERFLGRQIDMQLLEELESIGVDGCGENGEFHSFVVDGPLFSSEIRYSTGTVVSTDGYSFLPVTLRDRPGTGADA